MNAELVKEWVFKAEEDFQTAGLLFKAKKSPANLGFHCQQSLEKFLKAFLVMQNIIPPRKHDLIELIELVIPYDKKLSVFKDIARVVNPYAVIARYPGDEIVTLAEAKDVFNKTKEFYLYLRKITHLK